MTAMVSLLGCGLVSLAAHAEQSSVESIARRQNNFCMMVRSLITKSSAGTPLLPEEGWTRHKADAAKPPLHERLRMQARQGTAIKKSERTADGVRASPIGRS